MHRWDADHDRDEPADPQRQRVAGRRGHHARTIRPDCSHRTLAARQSERDRDDRRLSAERWRRDRRERVSVRGLSVTHKRFAVARGRSAVIARAPLGTAFRYTFSGPATVRITISQILKARRKRTARIEIALTRNEAVGANVRAFTGRTKTRTLRTGSYVASVTANQRCRDVSPADGRVHRCAAETPAPRTYSGISQLVAASANTHASRRAWRRRAAGCYGDGVVGSAVASASSCCQRRGDFDGFDAGPA